MLTERNFRIVDALLAVAKEVGRSPAQVAINWITRRPGVTSTIIGATRLEQLEDNLRALEFELPPELLRRLEEVSAPELRACTPSSRRPWRPGSWAACRSAPSRPGFVLDRRGARRLRIRASPAPLPR